MQKDQLVLVKGDARSVDFKRLGLVKIIGGIIYVKDIKTGREMGPFKESELVPAAI